MSNASKEAPNYGHAKDHNNLLGRKVKCSSEQSKIGSMLGLADSEQGELFEYHQPQGFALETVLCRHFATWKQYKN